MDILNFLSNNLLVVLGGSLFLAILIGLSSVIVYQQTKIKKLEQPKYGFLGKPIAASLLSTLVVAGLVGGIYLVNQEETTGPVAEADSAAVAIEASCVVGEDNVNFLNLDIDISIQDNPNSGQTADELLAEYLVDEGYFRVRSRLNPNAPESPEQTRQIRIEEGVFDYNTKIQFTISDLDTNYPVLTSVLGVAPQTGEPDEIETLGAELEEYNCNN